jgi:sulfate permease, SulP family
MTLNRSFQWKAIGHWLVFSNLRGDLAGALSAAMITLPMSIGYGMIAFGPLGPEFAPQGALLGVTSAILSGFVTALLGGTPAQITGPGALLTLVSATVVAGLAANPSLPVRPDSQYLFIHKASL